MRASGQIATGSALLALFAAMIGESLTLPAEAALAPLVVALPGAALCLVQIARDVLALRHEPRAAPSGPGPGLAWFAAFVFAVAGGGFIAGGPLILALYLRVAAGVSWLRAGAAAALLAGFLFGAVEGVLRIPLFPGLIFRSGLL